MLVNKKISLSIYDTPLDLLNGIEGKNLADFLFCNKIQTRNAIPNFQGEKWCRNSMMHGTSTSS